MREAILEAAADLFARHDGDPVGLDEIAATTGISIRQLHTYFTSATAIRDAWNGGGEATTATPSHIRSPDQERHAEPNQLHGTTRTVHYDVTREDSVRRLAGRSVEFVRKPDVVASARLLELCEWPCMEAVRDTIAAHECSLGARQRLNHRAPIAIGTHLAITARCTVARHPYSEWEVTVHDGHENVGHATLAFIVVDRADFEHRHVTPKIPGIIPDR